MRALLKDAPHEWLSVATMADPIPPAPFGEEIHSPCRAFFGRLERSRFAHWAHFLEIGASGRLEAKLSSLIQRRGVRAIHAIAHACWDTLAALNAAKRYRLPFFLSVHDDPAYLIRSYSLRKKYLNVIPGCWREASARFVISEEMGQELCRRWGRKDYILVTDGLEHIAQQPLPLHMNSLSVYFMGLFHLSYGPNIIALQKALKMVSEKYPAMKASLTLRCGKMPNETVVHSELTKVLPFGNESEVKSDLETSDVLYQPLSFEPAGWSMNAYSLSTKMITYLGSGLPILFHGPADSAAGRLLIKNDAAFACHSNNPINLAQTLTQAFGLERNQVVLSALNLANRQFQLAEIRDRFWEPIRVRLET